MKVIVYTEPSHPRLRGSCRVVIPAPKFLADYGTAAMDRLIEKSVPADATDVLVVDQSELPTYDEFRNAWKVNGQSVGVDMAAARDLWRDRIRAARAPALAALDAEVVRAEESPSNAEAKARIVARKQALRDLTADPRIDAAQTPDDLRAVWSEELA